MKCRRGDVLLAFYPFATGVGGSRRPVLVIQNDHDNQRLTNTVVAQITSNLKRSKEPTHLLIEVGTSEGAQSGLLHDSVVSCNNLLTLHENRIDSVIGHLPNALMKRINDCVKAALDLP